MDPEPVILVGFITVIGEQHIVVHSLLVLVVIPIVVHVARTAPAKAQRRHGR
jgi:hypothetical protein